MRKYFININSNFFELSNQNSLIYKTYKNFIKENKPIIHNPWRYIYLF